MKARRIHSKFHSNEKTRHPHECGEMILLEIPTFGDVILSVTGSERLKGLDSLMTAGYIVFGSPIIDASMSALEGQWNKLNARGMCKACTVKTFELIIDLQ